MEDEIHTMSFFWQIIAVAEELLLSLLIIFLQQHAPECFIPNIYVLFIPTISTVPTL